MVTLHLPIITSVLADDTDDVCYGRSLSLTRNQLGKLISTLRPGSMLHEGLDSMYQLLVQAEVDPDEPRMSSGWAAAIPPNPEITEDLT